MDGKHWQCGLDDLVDSSPGELYNFFDEKLVVFCQKSICKSITLCLPSIIYLDTSKRIAYKKLLF